MGHITHQYGPYYRPTPAPPQGRGAVRLSIRAIRPISPIIPIIPINPIWPISPKATSSPLWGDCGGLPIWVILPTHHYPSPSVERIKGKLPATKSLYKQQKPICSPHETAIRVLPNFADKTAFFIQNVIVLKQLLQLCRRTKILLKKFTTNVWQ